MTTGPAGPAPGGPAGPGPGRDAFTTNPPRPRPPLPWPSEVDLQLSMAVADIRTALRELGVLNRLTPVMFPTRPTPGPAPVAAAPSAVGGESDLDVPPRVVEAGASSDPVTSGVGQRVSDAAMDAAIVAVANSLATGVAQVAADFTLPRAPEFSMRSALNAAVNRRT